MGTFDVIDEEHTEFIRKAGMLGTNLVAFINPDNVVTENKGTPPVYTAEQRQKKLVIMHGVDEAYVACASKPEKIIDANLDVFVLCHESFNEHSRRLKDLLREKNKDIIFYNIRTGVASKDNSNVIKEKIRGINND